MKDSSTNKPWALLRISRRKYEILKPWKYGKRPMTRKRFEELLQTMMTDELYDLLKAEADATALLESIFGKMVND